MAAGGWNDVVVRSLEATNWKEVSIRWAYNTGDSWIYLWEPAVWIYAVSGN